MRSLAAIWLIWEVLALAAVISAAYEAHMLANMAIGQAAVIILAMMLFPRRSLAWIRSRWIRSRAVVAAWADRR